MEKKIPQIKLNVPYLLERSERIKETLTYDSMISRAGYAVRKDEMIIFTKDKGYLRLTKNEVRIVAEELLNISEDMERW